MKPTPKKVLLIISLIVGGLFWITLVLVLVNLFFNETPSIQKRIAAEVKLANKSTPKMLDSIVRFDKAVFLPKDTLLYNFSMINVEKENIDTANFVSIVQPDMLRVVKNEEKYRHLRENNFVIIYRYHYQDGQLIKEIVVTPRDYK